MNNTGMALTLIMALIREKHEMYEQHMEGADHDDFIKAEWAAGAMLQLYREARAIIHGDSGASSVRLLPLPSNNVAPTATCGAGWQQK